MSTNTPRYIVRKVGDQFIPMRQETVHPMYSKVLAGVGVWTGLWGVKQRGWVGLGAIAFGTCMTYRAFTGRSLLDELTCASCGKAPRGTAAESPSFPHEDRSQSAQVAADRTDEASMESFPASDPPARHRSTM